jgi:cytochrome c biogenesis protein CcmG/thiol:disulfide interchange protein DsbE
VRPSRPFVAVGVALVATLAAGCTAEAKSTDTPSPFAACAALTSPAAASSAGPSSAGPSSAGPSSVVPDLSLPCFTGGEKVALRSLRGPAVINLWASWCGPCRQELPVIQQLADQAGDKINVVGVDTGDGREAGASFAAAKGVTFPTLFDPDKKLLNALAKINLPITVFVDATGGAYVNVLPLDAAKLAEMVKEHTGVVVTR